MLRTAILLAAKDLRLFARDRTALMLAFLLPIVLGSVMGTAMGGPMAKMMPESSGASHAFSSMAVMMLMFSLVAQAGTLQDERSEGTLDRLRLMPSAGSAIVIGKVLAAMAMAIAQLFLLFLFGSIVFDVPVLDNLVPLCVTCVVWSFTASALGLLFATATRTRKQMEGLSTLFILGMSAMGGAWFPREIAPAWFQKLGLVTPVAWAMDAYHGILWWGVGWVGTGERSGILMPLAVLLGMGVVFLFVSTRFYRAHFAQR